MHRPQHERARGQPNALTRVKQADHVEQYVKSATHNRSGRSAVKSRFTRSGARTAAGSARVGNRFTALLARRMASNAIRRATRGRRHGRRCGPRPSTCDARTPSSCSPTTTSRPGRVPRHGPLGPTTASTSSTSTSKGRPAAPCRAARPPMSAHRTRSAGGRR